MKKLLITAASIAFVAAGTVYATADNHGMKEGKNPMKMGDGHKMGKKGSKLKMMDTDEDGKVSKDEYMDHATKRFSEKDGNGDGYITEEEMKAHHQAMKEKREAKHKEMQEKMFNEIDADGDGNISPEEMKTFHESKKGHAPMPPEGNTEGDMDE